MVLYRLKQLLQSVSRAFARFIARLRSAFQSLDGAALEQESAHSRQHTATIISSATSGGLASGRWLDDTHRLRPHLTATSQGWSVRDAANTAAPQPAPSNAANSAPLTSSPSMFTPSPAPASRPLDASREPTRPLPPRQPPEPSTPAAVPSSVPPQPITPSSWSPAVEEELRDVESRRRLLALRYLVRVGVYNEGFVAGDTPDQYQRSLGLGESPWQLDDQDDVEDFDNGNGHDSHERGDAHNDDTPYA